MLAQSMSAIQCRGYGGPEVLFWTESPMPSFEAGDVLIKVTAAGVNRADILQRQGKYPPPKGASHIMGMEVSGEVIAVGRDVKRWMVSDKVCALLSGGGYAEYVVAPEGQCLPVPSNLSMIEAASLIETIITVWANVFETAALKPKETILLHGGSSGIGITAIQLVKLFGAYIFVTAGNDEKCMACQSLGADLAINYHDDDFVSAVLSETNKRGVDVVLDMIGGDYVARNLSVLAPFGRHVSIATQKGSSITVDMRTIMQKQLMLTGSTLRARSAEEKARLVGEVEKNVWPLVLSGKFKPLIYMAVPINNAAEAHKVMESSQHIGKIILEVAA